MKVDLSQLWEALRAHGVEPLDEQCTISIRHYQGRTGPTTQVTAGYRHGRQVHLVLDAFGETRLDEYKQDSA